MATTTSSSPTPAPPTNCDTNHNDLPQTTKGSSPALHPLPVLSPDQNLFRVNEKRRRSTGDWSSVRPRQPNSSDSCHPFRYAGTPRASLGFHEHDARKLFDEDILEDLRQQRLRPTDIHRRRRPSLSGHRQLPQTSRYSFARSMKHFRRSLYWQLATLTMPMAPDGVTKNIQEFLLMGVLVFEAFYIPFALSYLADVEDAVTYQATAIQINIVVETLLLSDILVNFNTAVYDKPSKHSNLITSRRSIIRRYFTGSFFVDMLGSLPGECIALLSRTDGDTRSLLEMSLPTYIICHVLRFLRLRQRPMLYNSPWMKVLVAIAKTKAEAWCGAFQPVLCTIVKLSAGVVVIAHYLTCLLRVLHLSEVLSQPVSLTALYTTNLRQVMVGLFGRVKDTQQGVNDTYCIFLVLLGLMITAFVVSSVCIAVSNMHSSTQSKFSQNRQALTSRMEKLKLPNDLTTRIQKYCDHMWSEYDALDGGIMEFTRTIPQPLASEVLLHRYQDLLSGIEFWTDCSSNFLSVLVLAFEVRVFGPDNCILHEGSVGNELFMIHRGFVEQVAGKKEAQRLNHGDTFGEVALLLDYSRATKVRTVTYVECCVLSAKSSLNSPLSTRILAVGLL